MLVFIRYANVSVQLNYIVETSKPPFAACAQATARARARAAGR